MALDVRPFRKNLSNIEILNAIRGERSNAYQERIPEATQANIDQVIQNLLDYAPDRNEFVDGLVNRIGLVLFKNQIWTNPLAQFKRGKLEFGDTIEEIMNGLLQARRYIAERDYLEKDIFGKEVPEVKVAYHKVDRQDFYKLTVVEADLRKAFINPNGLMTFISNLINMAVTSDNWDEFLLMAGLFRNYYKAGGFFKLNVPDIGAANSTEAQAKAALRSVRTIAGNLKYLSRHYNAAGLPVAAQPEEMILFITPEANAALDVEALAGAFNIEKANVPNRIIEIPKEHFPAGAWGVLTTRDFFVVADSRLETTNSYNPVGLNTNYFLHHWEVISASLFVPAILLTTEPGDVIEDVDAPVTGVSALTAIDETGATVTNFTRGAMYEINAEPVTTGDATAVRYAITSQTFSQLTRINNSGAIVIGYDETATSVTVTAYAVDSAIPEHSASATYDLDGDVIIPFPNPSVLSDSDDDNLFEVTPKDLSLDEDDNVKIPTVTGVQYRKAGVDVPNGSVHNVTASTVFTAVARSGYELAAGATASWTLAP
jgi:hypothetical protein